MAKKVIIAEKPSVAREFAKVLKINGKNNDGYIESDEYIVTWCVGHLVTMSYPECYDEKLKYWNLNTLPFIPKDFKYEIIENVKKQFNIVSNILNREDVDRIYVCTDSGREGEYIYRLVDDMSGNPNKDKRRVWIDSQTEESILNGIKEAKPISSYNSLADSAYLRAKEDYLIGINFSRLLSLVYGKDLARKLDEKKVVISIGRVMSCVLGMIVKREREIRDFKKVNFYKIQCDFGNDNSSFIGEWKVNEKSKVFESTLLYNESGFLKEQNALKFINYIEEEKKEKKAFIKEVNKKTQKEKPPLLFNLAELQNECTKRFKISPDETLQVVQTLYEKKLVTYPRTDARVISSAVAKEISKNLNGLAKSNIDEEIKKHIDQMIKQKYSTKLEKTKYVDDTKITDHYAIIPTGQGFENYAKLEKLQKEIYHLIVRRFLSIFFPSAEYSKVVVVINIGNEEFSASGKVCTKLGYLDVVKVDKQIEEKNEEELKEVENNLTKEEQKTDNIQILGTLKKDQEINVKTFNIKEGETTPPNRYSSGSIILAMENAGKLIEDEVLREQIKGSGIGTSATRAEIIKKLERIEYINSNKKTQILTPTKKGEMIFDIVNSSMSDMLNPDLSASWEKGLNMVAENEISSEQFMNKLEEYIKTKVVKFKKARNEYLFGM
ncbi:MAG: DNA topoisomerase [Clostridia bacterium]